MSMRSVCFPYYLEFTNREIPANSRAQPMVAIEKEGLRLNWSAPLDSTNVYSAWVYYFHESTDNYSHESYQQFLFFPVFCNNLEFALKSNQFWSYALSSKQAIKGT